MGKTMREHCFAHVLWDHGRCISSVQRKKVLTKDKGCMACVWLASSRPDSLPADSPANLLPSSRANHCCSM